MRPLYFAASLNQLRLPSAMAQVWEGLKPCRGYLQAALRAAKERQVRHKVDWERAELLFNLRLEAQDSLFELQETVQAFCVKGIPPTYDIDSFPRKLLVDWSSLVEVTAVETSGQDIYIQLAEKLPFYQELSWRGIPIQLEPVLSRRTVQNVYDETGKRLNILQLNDKVTPAQCVIEGHGHSQLYSEQGERLPWVQLPPDTGLNMLRQKGREEPYHSQLKLEVKQLPSLDFWQGNNGVRFRSHAPPHKQSGEWIQLIVPKDQDGELSIDPRAAFCEDGVREVRVEGSHETLRVITFRREQWQLLLERLPPEGHLLQLPVNLNALYRQRDAIQQLNTAPLPHHRGLLRLFEDPQRAAWPPVAPVKIAQWFVLKDAPLGEQNASGTDEQRRFVQKALGTPDFAFLEGPPGSGKTHTICELILQLLARGQRILLCSTTHVAVDNVLERLVGTFPEVEALRIGRLERVDERVKACQLDQRLEVLESTWQKQGLFTSLNRQARQDLAERIVLDSVNLTCGTTTGILAHPALHGLGEKSELRGRPPLFDVLILDEASKTTFQEFLVPALLAKRWVIVGDVRQLSPFTERKDLEASIEGLQDEPVPGSQPQQRKTLPVAQQRACLLLHQLTQQSARQPFMRWGILDTPEVLRFLCAELRARIVSPFSESAQEDARAAASAISTVYLPSEVVSIEKQSTGSPQHFEQLSLISLTPEQVRSGARESLHLLSASWVLIPTPLWSTLETCLPPDLGIVSTEHPFPATFSTHQVKSWQHRRNFWEHRHNHLLSPLQERGQSFKTYSELHEHHRQFLEQHTWSGEVAWRLSRHQQLSLGKNPRARQRLTEELDQLLPRTQGTHEWVSIALKQLRDIGLRSMLEVLKLGGNEQLRIRSNALREGLPTKVWESRAMCLSFQHRMHPDISKFPRQTFYEDRALQDANTLTGRDARVGWQLETPARRLWCDVKGIEDRGVNAAEVKEIRRWLELWRKRCTGLRQPDRPEGTPRSWEIALLAFYNKQELALRNMLRELTGQTRRETRFELPYTEIVCGSVDRFQGREADLVLLSMRNTRRVGHIDSPNRLNVAITRARHLLVVVGHQDFYKSCRIDELEALASQSVRSDSVLRGV